MKASLTKSPNSTSVYNNRNKKRRKKSNKEKGRKSRRSRDIISGTNVAHNQDYHSIPSDSREAIKANSDQIMTPRSSSIQMMNSPRLLGFKDHKDRLMLWQSWRVLQENNDLSHRPGSRNSRPCQNPTKFNTHYTWAKIILTTGKECLNYLSLLERSWKTLRMMWS